MPDDLHQHSGEWERCFTGTIVGNAGRENIARTTISYGIASIGVSIVVWSFLNDEMFVERTSCAVRPANDADS